MRKKLLTFLMVAFVALMSSCVGDDIDSLQGQIDDLNTKVVELEESQQEALLAEIAALQVTITAMQANMETGDSDLATKYAVLLSSLDLLEDEVANNTAAVYYGNLLTDADFNAYVTQGATIVTGKVVASTQAHIDALTTCKMVGVDLVIQGADSPSLVALEAVGGMFVITGINEVSTMANFPALSSVGDDFNVFANDSLKSVSAGALVLVNGVVSASMNAGLKSLSFEALDQVQGINIDGYDETTYGAGALNSVKLSSTNVIGDFTVKYVADGALSVGNVGGTLTVTYNSITEFSTTGELVEDDFIFENNTAIVSMDVTSLTTINGSIRIAYNGAGGSGGISSTSTTDFATSFPSFENLVTINGDVYIGGNNTSSIEAFNNVTTYTGSLIDIQANGYQVDLLSVFNGLVDGGTSLNINVFGNYAWYNSFNLLEKAKVIIVNVSPKMDPSTYMYDDNLRVDGFNALTQATSIQIYTPKVTVFSAFASLDHLTYYGTDLKVEMPEDANVGFCSMEPFFTKYNTDPTKYVVEFNQGWGNTLDPSVAIDILLEPCAK